MVTPVEDGNVPVLPLLLLLALPLVPELDAPLVPELDPFPASSPLEPLLPELEPLVSPELIADPLHASPNTRDSATQKDA